MSSDAATQLYPLLTPTKIGGKVVKPPFDLALTREQAVPYFVAGVIGRPSRATVEDLDNTNTNTVATNASGAPAGEPAGAAVVNASTETAQEGGGNQDDGKATDGHLSQATDAAAPAGASAAPAASGNAPQQTAPARRGGGRSGGTR